MMFEKSGLNKEDGFECHLWNKQANFIFVAEILNNYHVNLNKLFELKLPNTNIPTSLF